MVSGSPMPEQSKRDSEMSTKAAQVDPHGVGEQDDRERDLGQHGDRPFVRRDVHQPRRRCRETRAATNTIGIVNGQRSIRIDTAANAMTTTPNAAISAGSIRPSAQRPDSSAMRFFVAAHPQMGHVDRS